MKKEKVKEILKDIIKNRNIFHSEGDLQFDFAFKLKEIDGYAI